MISKSSNPNVIYIKRIQNNQLKIQLYLTKKKIDKIKLKIILNSMVELVSIEFLDVN